MMLLGCAENCFPRFLSRRLAAVVAAYSTLDRDFIAASGKYLSPVTELFLPLFVRQLCLPHIFKLSYGLCVTDSSRLLSCRFLQAAAPFAPTISQAPFRVWRAPSFSFLLGVLA